MTTQPTDPDYVQSLARRLAVIEAFTEARRPLTLSDVARGAADQPGGCAPDAPYAVLGSGEAQQSLCDSTVQRAWQAAMKASGLHKPATVHTLRHPWATHLLE